MKNWFWNLSIQNKIVIRLPGDSKYAEYFDAKNSNNKEDTGKPEQALDNVLPSHPTVYVDALTDSVPGIRQYP